MSIQGESPLDWPIEWPRTQAPKQSSFHRKLRGDILYITITQAIGALEHEMRLLGATNVVLSSNLKLRQSGTPVSEQREPSDRGVAVYFEIGKKRRVLAGDKWDRVADNIYAVAKHIEAMRGQARWGIGSQDRAFSGYTALPAAGETSDETWWSVLGVKAHSSLDEIRAAYRAKVKTTHPDMGGSVDAFQRVQSAWERACKELELKC